MKHYDVVAAVIVDEHEKIFCAQRGNKGELALKWEFPGGKIEDGESKEDALIREIKEELNTDIDVIDYITTVRHQYDTFNITMHAYYAKVKNGLLELSEHIDSKWLLREELDILHWADADIPIVEKLMNK